MAPRRKNLKEKAGDSKSNGTSGRRKVCSRMGASEKFAHRTLRQSTWWLTWRQRRKVSHKLYQWRTTDRVMEWWRDIYAWRAAKRIRKAGGGSGVEVDDSPFWQKVQTDFPRWRQFHSLWTRVMSRKGDVRRSTRQVLALCASYRFLRWRRERKERRCSWRWVDSTIFMQ